MLDYAVPVFHHAARSHQDKLARIQLQAACLITGLWRRTPTDIILIEADLIPINSEQHLATTKYMGKLRSLENHKTADLVKYWWSPGRPRIKKTSLLHSYRDRDIMLVSIPPSQPPPTNPLQAIPNITCADNTDPPINVKKADVDPLTLLSKALMTIEKMPSSAILIYTDGNWEYPRGPQQWKWGIHRDPWQQSTNQPEHQELKTHKQLRCGADRQHRRTPNHDNDEEDRRDLHPDRLQVIRADPFLPGKSISPYSYTHSETGYWLLI